MDERRNPEPSEKGKTNDLQVSTYKDSLLKGSTEDKDRNMDEGQCLRTLGESKIFLEGDKVWKEMLDQCLVGEALNPIHFEELKKALMNDWVSMEAVKMMGSIKALMIFDSAQSMQSALQLDSLRKHLLEVRRWSIGEVNRSRKLWLEIIGLLIHGWTRDNMLKIGNVWGRVLEVEEAEETHYSFFRVLVAANASPAIRAWATIVIDNKNFDIFVKEDGGYLSQRQDFKGIREETDCSEASLGHTIVDKEQEFGENGMNRVGSEDGEGMIIPVDSRGVATLGEEAEESKVGETQ
ncbi:hypothetical protein PIB30_093734 [Stylosanthes scabra]|uniref:DUF4283 domain-containing protein n=1 Tax=Stylosanthes scabra TaxID=79078 RepID=A0ABU6ZTW1_9FABA|nr:hypothetical protein [Stylosanthes scabra]